MRDRVSEFGVKTLAEWLEREVCLRTNDGFLVRCKVLDAKYAYGQLRVHVTPTAGSGESWVSADRCQEVSNG